ncbi:MAG: hypothetical protein ACOYN5_15885, partial [Bacteroidales bacterium]
VIYSSSPFFRVSFLLGSWPVFSFLPFSYQVILPWLFVFKGFSESQITPDFYFLQVHFEAD